MRTDEQLDDALVNSPAWPAQEHGDMPSILDVTERNANGQMQSARSHSFSGHEPNNFFYNQEGTSFSDLSALSGLDTRADSRGMAFLDYNRDGWQDIVLVNANTPQLQLFRNRIGDLTPVPRNSVAVRLIGANHSAQARPGTTCRDGFGTRIEVVAGGTTTTRELLAGEGFASQNSKTITVGIGTAAAADSVNVIWPSGERHIVEGVPAGSLVEVFEKPSEAPNKIGFRGSAQVVKEVLDPPAPEASTFPISFPDTENKTIVLTTFSTTCPACRLEHAQLHHLKKLFGDQAIFLGLPANPDDTPALLERYERDLKPAYRILRDLQNDELTRVAPLFSETANSLSFPMTAIIDPKGRLVSVTAGSPSASQLAESIQKSQ